MVLDPVFMHEQSLMETLWAGLGRICKLNPKQNGGKSDHSQEILSSLLVAGCHAPKLFETIDQAFDEIALFIQGSVKGSSTRLIATARNRVANSSAFEIVPDLPTTVGFISQQALWPQLGTPSPHSLDGPLLHQRFQFGGFMALPSREDKGYRFAFSFSTQMQLRAKTTLTFA